MVRQQPRRSLIGFVLARNLLRSYNPLSLSNPGDPMKTVFRLGQLSLLFILLVVAANAQNSDKAIASKFATVDGLKLHYLTAGHGPAVILLHGYTQTSRMWRPLMPLLT